MTNLVLILVIEVRKNWSVVWYLYSAVRNGCVTVHSEPLIHFFFVSPPVTSPVDFLIAIFSLFYTAGSLRPFDDYFHLSQRNTDLNLISSIFWLAMQSGPNDRK